MSIFGMSILRDEFRGFGCPNTPNLDTHSQSVPATIFKTFKKKRQISIFQILADLT